MKKLKFLKGNNLNKTQGGKKMKISKLWILGLMAILVIEIVYSADPTCTFDQALGTYPKGSAYNLSMTITNPGEGEGNNATMGIITIGSGTITGALTFNTSDGTNNTYMNFTVNTLALPDDTLATYTINMYNESQNAIGTACTRAYNPDNSVPVITAQLPADGSRDNDGTITFSNTCTNASSGTITIDGTSYVMTESSDSCSTTLVIPTNGFHTYNFAISDGLNITTDSSRTIEVRRPGGPGVAEGGQITQVGGQSILGNLFGGNSGAGIAGMSGTTLLLIGAAVWFVFIRKKK